MSAPWVTEHDLSPLGRVLAEAIIEVAKDHPNWYREFDNAAVVDFAACDDYAIYEATDVIGLALGMLGVNLQSLYTVYHRSSSKNWLKDATWEDFTIHDTYMAERLITRSRNKHSLGHRILLPMGMECIAAPRSHIILLPLLQCMGIKELIPGAEYRDSDMTLHAPGVEVSQERSLYFERYERVSGELSGTPQITNRL